MPKPNYGFEKRQREQEKKRKKQEKALRKDSHRPAEPGDPAQQDAAPDVGAPGTVAGDNSTGTNS
jgi:hypothetical protein